MLVSRSCRRLAEDRSGDRGIRTFVGRCRGCCGGCCQVESSIVAGDDVTWGQFGSLQEEMVRFKVGACVGTPCVYKTLDPPWTLQGVK